MRQFLGSAIGYERLFGLQFFEIAFIIRCQRVALCLENSICQLGDLAVDRSQGGSKLFEFALKAYDPAGPDVAEHG